MQRTFAHRTGVYRSKDPITNLRIKLTILKLNTLIQESSLPQKSSPSESQPSSASFTFAWQQKTLGQHELRRYGDLANCSTDLQKKYHQLSQIENDAAAAAAETHVFTYVQDDEYGGLCPDSHSHTQKWSAFQANIDQLYGRCERMHVMAHLGDKPADSRNETELFALFWSPDTRTLSVYPDFNQLSATPYLHEINSNSRHWYQYALENVSSVWRTEDGDVEALLVEQMQDVHIGHRHPTVTASCFSNPTSGCHRPHTFVSLLLELVSAEQFDCDRLHVRYTIRLPANCRAVLGSSSDVDSDVTTSTDACSDYVEDTPLAACTHTSQCRSNGDGIWWLGFTHELNLMCRSSSNSVVSAADNHMLHISYDVVCVDRWTGRERIVGSAVQTVALLQPCSSQPDRVHHTQPLLCYQVNRLQSTSSWFGWLERLLMPAMIGGSVSGGGRPTTADDDCIMSSTTSRFGVQTLTTGVLNVRTHIVRQRAAVAELTTAAAKRHGLIHKSTAMPMGIDEVIGAYELAKRRLLQQLDDGDVPMGLGGDSHE